MGVRNSKNNKDITEINIIYNTKKEEYIRLFGDTFVKNNKKNCKMIIVDKESEIKSFYYAKNYRSNILIIKLKGINNVTNMSSMFDRCSSLLSLPDISKWNTNNVIDMNCMFSGCLSLSSLPDISKWNISNVNVFDKSYIFYGCPNIIFPKNFLF